MSSLRQTPLTCSGHTRPVVFLAFSDINPEGQYYSISACKDGESVRHSPPCPTCQRYSKHVRAY